MAIFGLLPILTLMLIFYFLPIEGRCLRTRAINAAVVWGALITLTTEVLSVFTMLTRGWVFAVWVAVGLIIAWILVSRRIFQASQEKPSNNRLSDQIPEAYQLAILAIGLVLALTGLIAVVAPPNTWDSMAYHMPRVAHWIQNGTVRHYPTVYLPQLYHPPWAEFAITHLHILSDSDRFANAIQWFSMVGCVIGVSLIAKLLGAESKAQVFASVLAATIPMGILQASSTQNDLVVTFWLVCFVVYVLRLVRDGMEGNSRGGVVGESVIGAGVSLGLALLTKGTAYIYSVPFLCWLTLHMVKRDSWRALQVGFVLVSLIAFLNGGHFLRNTQLFGLPLATGGERYVNELLTPASIASNIVRNLSLHVGTPFQAVNVAIEKGIHRLHGVLGIAADDSRTSAWMGDEGFSIHRMDTVEDFAGNPLHALLIIVSISVFAFQKSIRVQQHIMGYIFAICAAALLFNVLLKWQPWHSRLHLPIFILFAPFVAIVTLHWRPRLAKYIMVVLLVCSMPWVLANQTRSLVPVFRHHKSIVVEDRIEQYFQRAGRPLMEPYIAATLFLRERNVRNIGLILPYDPFEYQFWVLLKQGRTDIRLEHIDVDNVSSVATREGTSTRFVPESIIAVRDGIDQIRPELHTGMGVYKRAWSMGQVGVYLPVQ